MREDNKNLSVKKGKGFAYECDCATFRDNTLICEHSLAAAEMKSELQEYLLFVTERHERATLQKNLPKSSGQKKTNRKGKTTKPRNLEPPGKVRKRVSSAPPQPLSTNIKYIKISPIPSSTGKGTLHFVFFHFS